LLLGKKSVHYAAILLFWLGFWTIVNSTGYLIIGGLSPFGDVYGLIALGVLTSSLSLQIGLIFFLMVFALSQILRKRLSEMCSPEKVRWGISFFWLIIPMLVTVMLASPERNLPLVCLVLAFAPVVVSFLFEHCLVLTEHKADEDPNDVAK